MKKIIVFLMLFLGSFLFFQVYAQESTNFKLKEHIFNQGGHPIQGAVLTTANFKITIGSVGELTDNSQLNSDSFSLEGGFISSFPPPGEVADLHFHSDHQTLTWNPEKSKGSYNLYRDLISSIKPDYGACKEYGITDETTTDSDDPGVGNGYFYLVTVRNRLNEEGTKGYSSSAERPNDYPCP
jgi:hypothetical protein